MGPRPIGRGMLPGDVEAPQGMVWLQWAAADRPRNATLGPGLIRRNTGFNGAAADRPRNESIHPRFRHQHPSFNGPRPIGRGMVRLRLHGRRQHASMGPRPIGRGMLKLDRRFYGCEIASMGPRPIGRGMAPWPNWTYGEHSGFNGAAADRPRNAASSLRHQAYAYGFNGAAADRPRNACSCESGPTPWFTLQWGRGRSAAEWTRGGRSDTWR